MKNSQHPIQHYYFLDAYDAINAIAKSQAIDPENFDLTTIYYYDGVWLNSPHLNLINVPLESIVDFFSQNTLPLPSELIFNEQNLDSEIISQMHEVFQQSLNQVKILRHQRMEKEPFECDTYFLDPAIACQTAIQLNRVYQGHP
ncbi:MAG: hypothetical protein OEY38_23790, partial [Gammaproteobacteria bacterium]|nr:hypothetical protein [Gammaproteobacteria bacterium]